MRNSSQHFDFDNRLLAVEELLRQRHYSQAHDELKALSEDDFGQSPHELGLFLSLQADDFFNEGEYQAALTSGLRAAKVLAGFPMNRRYGRTLLVLSKSYSALGDLRLAEMKASDSLASFRRCGEALGQVDALNELARVAFLRSDFARATDFLSQAIDQADGDARKEAQLRGNAGRIRVLAGQWMEAETDILSAIEYDRREGTPVSLVRNLLSLSYLHILKREFVFAERTLVEVDTLIEEHGFKRERVIYLEYAGELAFEKGDIFKAKSLLSEAYHEGRLMAPNSALVSQSGRRLAEVEFALDNLDEAMKYAQKALETAQQIGEKSEITAAHRVIAMVFAARAAQDDAYQHLAQAMEVARVAGDPIILARTLIAEARIRMDAGSEDVEKIRGCLDEAGRLFRRLKSDFWLAEADFLSGVLACQGGDLARGFKKLSRAERAYVSLGESVKVKSVHKFLVTLSDQAVALSVSQENEYKVFGNMVNQSDLKEVRTGGMDEVLQVLLRRTHADRAIIFTPEFDDNPLTSSVSLSSMQVRKFIDGFEQMLGQEVSPDQPTLRLDCRRDPYVNGLLSDIPDVVASVIVVPFRMGGQATSFIYLDRISVDNTLNPFSQAGLNFAVGFSEMIAFKLSELQKMKLQEDNRRLKAQLQKEAAFPNIITRNSEMLQMLAQVRQVVDSNISVSIEGETGCGKDLLARAIHYNSERRDRRFISVNCAALPESLLESELFGYQRGAFTGADRDKPGLFEEADGGTFFLDEIGDMPLSVQAKILRVLEEKEVVRLGESTPRKVDVRIVSATNKDLKELMAQHAFRTDLYYRLSALTFRLPPLRDRREDIPLLVEKFTEGSGIRVGAEVMKELVAYDWPGNVRELENEVKKLILLAGDTVEIGIEILSNKLFAMSSSKQSGEKIQELGIPDDVSFSDSYSLYDYLAAHEREFIVKALRERNGVKKHAAALLSIPESTLRLKIKQYSIDMNRLDAIN